MTHTFKKGLSNVYIVLRTSGDVNSEGMLIVNTRDLLKLYMFFLN